MRAQKSSDTSDFIHDFKLLIERSASATHTLAALVTLANGPIEKFRELVQTLLPSYPGVTGMVVAPQGVITQSCCRSKSDTLLGLDLLEDPVQKTSSILSINYRRLTLVGPITFPQGEKGLVARLPVFLNQATTPEFWGFVDVGIELKKIVAAALIDKRLKGDAYELWRNNPTNQYKQIILSNTSNPLSEPIKQHFHLINDDWYLILSPHNGWEDVQFKTLTASLWIIFNALISYLAFLALRLNRQGIGLEAQIVEGKAEVGNTRQQIEATFDSIPDLAWLKDHNGVYLNCNRRFESLYGQPKNHIVGHTDYEFVEQELADFFRHNDLKAIEAGVPQVNEEWLTFALDGYQGLFETIKTPIKDASGQNIGILGIARDITEHRRRAEALRESEIQLTVTLESTQIGIWDWNLKNDQWSASAAYFGILGRKPITGHADRQQELTYVHPDDRAHVADRINEVLRNHLIEYHYEARMRHVDGRYRWISVRGKVVEQDDNGAPTRLVGVRMDISELKKAEEKAYWLAHYDALTGLPNRVMLLNQLPSLLIESNNNNMALALLFIDLDQFKNINDSHGHSVGDSLLQAVAQRMLEEVKDNGIVSRQGGDEFVLLLPNVDTEMAEAAARRLIQVLSKPHKINQYELFITPSIGISMSPSDGDNFNTLLQCADVAMYCAKHTGRNTFRFFSHTMRAKAVRKTEIETGLRRALNHNELTLYYQPQVDIHNQSVIGVEALLRWQHPTLGHISPSEFIPIAEESGLIMSIGEWVLTSAIRQMHNWLKQGLSLQVIAVNLSAIQFRHPNLSERISEILKKEQLEAKYLELELTERIAMDDPDKAVSIMQSLTQKGIHLSIDDFGTGYSSLNYIKRFQLSKLKIDKSFIQTLPHDGDDKAITITIISLAKNLGLSILAEGVETREQLAFLHNEGCEEIQGFYFSHPVPAQAIPQCCREIEEKLANNWPF